MKFRVHLESTGDGDYLASCDDPQAAGRGLSPVSALDHAELRYQLEMCPCHGVDPGQIELEVSS